uniref:Transmembrane protein 120A n=1 Tax=Amazona collaria TaxID=241587 RepID=A0A8B9GNU4_9PSIT
MSAMAGSAAECLREWEELQDGFQRIQDNHKLYKQKLEELTKLQDGISSSIARQKKRLKELALSFKKCKAHASPEQQETIQETQSLIKERQNVFFEMEAYLPKKNGLYLSLVLGNVNVTLLSKQAKFAYKDEYEKFKLYLTIILLIISSSCRFLVNTRVTDAVFNFLLVWYYCTLTIRESILINNGSKIKGWWVFHHYISTFLSGVMLTWPDGLMYQMFRNQFLSFSMYQSFVQFLQYYYQSGCLYRLRALGERHNMDLTVASSEKNPDSFWHTAILELLQSPAESDQLLQGEKKQMSDSRTAEQLEKQGREQQGNILLMKKATLWVCPGGAIAESPVHSTKGLKALSITKMNSNLPSCLKRKQRRITESARFISPDKSLSFYL